MQEVNAVRGGQQQAGWGQGLQCSGCQSERLDKGSLLGDSSAGQRGSAEARGTGESVKGRGTVRVNGRMFARSF